MASRTVSKDIITLKGSAAIVSEFFGTLRGEQHPVQPRGVPGGELRQGEEVRPHHAAHAGRGRQDLHHQPHLPALRVARGREAAEDCLGHHEQGHLRGARALELQHRDRRRGRREGGDQGEERQGNHEGDPGHHAAGRVLHLLSPLPRRAMHIRRAGLHRHGHHRSLHLGRERRQAHRQPADGEAAFVRHQDPQGGHAGVIQERRLGRVLARGALERQTTTCWLARREAFVCESFIHV